MRVAIIGAGAWGTAVAGMLSRAGHQVTLWARRGEVANTINQTHYNPSHLTSYKLPESLYATSNLSEAIAGADAVVIVTPSTVVRKISKDLSPYLAKDTPIVVLSKGIEKETGFVLSDVVADEVGHPERVALLSGPNHAEEVSRNLPAAAVSASVNPKIAEFFQQLFHSETFRVYVSTDVIGVGISAACKNIIAIVVGLCAGSNLGDNAIALIMTRGLAEMSRLVAAYEGNPVTCMGLSGVGDLIATCTSEHSRNRSFGTELAKGVSLDKYIERENVVVEGAQAVISVKKLAEAQDVDMPIVHALHKILYEDKRLEDVADSLMGRSPKTEVYGIEEDAWIR